MRRIQVLFIGTTFLAVSALAPVLVQFSSALPKAPATLQVNINAPDGVAATVDIVGSAAYAATKQASGTSASQSISVAPGTYRIRADALLVEGTLFTSRITPSRTTVSSGATKSIAVTYSAATMVTDFRVTNLEDGTVTLSWKREPGVEVEIRRTQGNIPAATADQGVAVATSGSTAVDPGLPLASVYTYALFAEKGREEIGPFPLSIGTGGASDGQATYLANPQTRMLSAADVANAEPDGTGVVVTLASGVKTPVLGAPVVVPAIPSLQGGFLGTVESILPNGRTIRLVAAGIADAFDYYSVSAADLKVSSQTPTLVAAAALPAPVGAASALPTALANCVGGSASDTVSLNAPSFQFSGHFNATINTKSFFGKNIPTGASLDLGVSLTVTESASIKSTNALTCSLDLKQLGLDKLMVEFPTTPVPMALAFFPKIEASVQGQFEADNVGVSVKTGFQVAATIPLLGLANVSGGPIMSIDPLTPNVTSASAGFGMKVGGQVIIGPGAGTTESGVIAGVSGEFNPIDAFVGVEASNSGVCLKANLGASYAFGFTAKAWLGKWSIAKTFTIDALNQKIPYSGSPWYWPSGCNVQGPGTTVLGPGVTKVTDSTSGGQGQIGYVPGFVPGQSAWVLSTGDVANAVGAPSAFASTDLGLGGDGDLTALSGNQTYDAVTYDAVLVPTGSTLHVRFVFASEEYPEYVGSAFNDVMAVFVNGTNCATVPGTSAPVSVNTINASLNSQYFIDNASGASGLGTTMDGVTIPLQCDVPVTPGVPSTVKIALADASDHVFDSAVALLDQGIWSN
jgi:hypothetical protein